MRVREGAKGVHSRGVKERGREAARERGEGAPSGAQEAGRRKGMACMRDDSPKKGMRLGKVREGTTGDAQWKKGSRKRNLREEKGKARREEGKQERLKAVPMLGTAKGGRLNSWRLHL